MYFAFYNIQLWELGFSFFDLTVAAEETIMKPSPASTKTVFPTHYNPQSKAAVFFVPKNPIHTFKNEKDTYRAHKHPQE